jgi:hypothetical protein
MKTEVKISKDGKSKTFSLDMAKLFLELVGGGLTVKQTAKAIDLNREFSGAGKIEFNGFLIEKI